MKEIHGQLTGIASPFLTDIRMKKVASIVRGGDVLDYGCDWGKLREMLQYRTYTGVDLDPEVIAYARQRNSGLNNVFFYTVEEFESYRMQFDYILLLAVIEHFDNPEEILSKLKKRLKFQGKIIVTTPTHFGNTLLTIGSKVGIVSRTAFEEHNTIFSRNDFFLLAKKLGLNIIEYTTFEFGLNQLVVLSREKMDA